MTTEPREDIYPQYCFHLSPTLDHWCHFRTADLVRLTSHPGFNGQHIYFHKNHPIKWVRVCGVVVAISELDGRRIYTIDDSSGETIDCVLNVPRSFGGQGPDVGTAEWNYKVKEDTTGRTFATVDAPIDVGHVLDIKGSVDEFREEKQIVPDKIKHLRTTEQEALFWAKAAQLRRGVLDKPWVLDHKVVRALRCEAEGKKLKRRETGLEKQGTRRRREVDEIDEISNPPQRPRHRESGLEPATKRRKVDEDQTLSTARPRRQTGLEPAVKRPKANEEKLARPRSAQTGLEPTTKHKVVVDDTLHNPPDRHTTGLEKVESKQNLEATTARITRSRYRETGLEPKVVKTHQVSKDDSQQASRSRSHKTGLEPVAVARKLEEDPSHRSRPKVTGLERQFGTVDRPKELGRSSRATGLEKYSQIKKPGASLILESHDLDTDVAIRVISSRQREAPKPLTVRSHITGLERQPLQVKHDDRRLAGLESPNKKRQPERKPRTPQLTMPGQESKSKTETDTIEKTHSRRRTGLESQSARMKEVGPNPSIGRHRVTGLEKRRREKEPDSHAIVEDEDSRGQNYVDRWHIGKPGKQVVVRGRIRTSGLERKVKAVTRATPVTDQYDVVD
ncbi:hypothetical protein QBC38DRAFT_462910 [Podospora fimiseda]|uniref:CST complex subunit Stn1 N-terminal domain-containing protein n=1 Tax=Podospora fimiseda TaxID=252190 RepID=A0AAN7BZG8_9PEZI|nr:hypothetical protein QBC38DRAFT_462910 [Podospora fimiseda]